MKTSTAEQVYEEMVRLLSVSERLRLVGRIVQELGRQVAEQRHDWMAVRGIAPGLTGQEDAQSWVSRSRAEADEQREQKWRPSR